MNRKEELEKIIEDAKAELAPIKEHETYVYYADTSIKDFKRWGLSEEEVLSLVDAVYHSTSDLTDEH